MSWLLGPSRCIRGLAGAGERPSAPRVPAYAGWLDDTPAAQRQARASQVRYVFELIWPQARIECRAGEAGCRVDVWQGGLHHAVDVPWPLVECDRGLMLVRAVYRAGLPDALQRAGTGLSLSL